MREKICVFPFDEEFIPFLNMVKEKVRSNNITCYTVKGNYYYNKEVTLPNGEVIKVYDIKCCFDSDFDIFLLTETNIDVDFNTEILPVMKRANDLHKEIRVRRFLSKEELDLCKELGIKMSLMQFDEIEIDKQMTERIFPIKTPIIFVFGIFENTDKLYTELYIHQYFKDKGIQIKSILSRINGMEINDCYSFPEFILNNKYSDNQKIIMFNHYIRRMELKMNPDVILVGIPGEIMPLDEKHFGHFGITPYLISNAVKCDYAVLQAFNNLCDKTYINGLKEICNSKFAIEIDACCISHTVLDFSSLRDAEIKFYNSSSKPINAEIEYYFDFKNGFGEELGENVLRTLAKYGNFKLL